MRLLKSAGIASAVCLVTIAATACSSSGSGNSTSKSTSTGGTLTIALPTPPVSLDPSKGGNGTTAMMQTPAYGSLLHLEGNGGTESASLAQSFKWLDTKNSKLEVVLRPGLKFSDGTPLDSAAVKASAQHFATNGSAFAYVAAQIASIATPSPTTVDFTLKGSDPTFPNLLAETSGLGMIISPKAIAAQANLGTSTAGAGPYELSAGDTVQGSTYTYVPNPYFYDKSQVHYQKIVIKVISDANTALAALQSGQVQVAYGTPAGNSQAKAAGLQIASFPGATDALFLQDTGALQPALGSLQVRQALNYAIDRAGASKVVTLGTGTPTVQLPVPGSLGYDASLEGTYPYDVAKAKQLLAQGGYPNGFAMSVVVPSFQPGASNLAQILVSQLAKIGVTLNLVPVTTIGAYAAAEGTGKQNAVIFSVGFPLGIPSAVSLIFGPTALGNPKHNNFPTVLPAAAAASAIPIAQSSAAWKAINKTIVDQALAIPVGTESYAFYYKNVNGVSDSISVNPINITPAN